MIIIYINNINFMTVKARKWTFAGWRINSRPLKSKIIVQNDENHTIAG